MSAMAKVSWNTMIQMIVKSVVVAADGGMRLVLISGIRAIRAVQRKHRTSKSLPVLGGIMIISEFIERLEQLKEVAGDVDVIIQPCYDEPFYEIAGAECIRVVEGKTPDGDKVWVGNFEPDDPRIVTRIRVF
jgi:hypothetical protein